MVILLYYYYYNYHHSLTQGHCITGCSETHHVTKDYSGLLPPFPASGIIVMRHHTQFLLFLLF